MIDTSTLELWLRERTQANRACVVSEYRYLCARAARRFLRGGLDRSDLEQVAAIGLIKAVDRYDVACATPFEAYAWVLMLGELMHHVRDSEYAVRPPRKLRELDKRWKRIEGQMLNEVGREPSESEISARLGLNEKSCRELRAYQNSQYPISLDAVKSPVGRCLSYRIEDDLEALALEQLLEALSPLERRIVTDIYQIGIPLGSVAVRLGYSRRHTTRLHRSALEKIRHAYATSEGT